MNDFSPKRKQVGIEFRSIKSFKQKFQLVFCTTCTKLINNISNFYLFQWIYDVFYLYL